MNYYALLVVSILLTALFMEGNKKNNKKYVVTACILLFAIYGLRNTYRIGVDTTSSYLGNFQQMRRFSWSEVLSYANGINTGYYLMTKAFSTYISSDYQLYITLISLFVTYCFGRMLYRYSPSPVQSILYHFGLLLFIFHFSALKQSIAMAILMLAFDSIFEKRPVKYLILVFLASQFHLPSVIFLPAYLLSRLRIGRNYLFLLTGLLVVTYLFRNQIINIMNSMYKGSDEEIDLSGIQFMRTKALIMVVIAVTAVFFRRPTQDDPVYTTLLGFIGIATVFQTFCGYSNSFERLADYYFQFSVILIPMVFDKTVTRRALFSWRFMEVIDTLAPYLFCGFGIYRFLSFVSNYSFYSPFLFFFQQ